MTRVVSGAVMVALAVGAVWLAPPLLFLLVAQLLVVLGVIEYARLAPGTSRTVPTAVVAAAAVVASVALARGGPGSPLTIVALLVSVIALGTVSLVRWHGGADALPALAVAVLPMLYLGLPIGALVMIRDRQGPAGLFLLMGTVMISDTAQYYTGRTWGRRPLAATVSPKKTIEGAIGGLVCGPLAFAWIGTLWLPDVMSLPLRVALGVVIVAAGIAGDLFESMLKRSAGVKDSGALIPGHGGVLDRIDALLFAAPVYLAALTFL